MEGQELTIYETDKDLMIERPPEIVLKEARDAAKALADVVSKKKKPVIMNGEQYLEFEDWQTVGRFYGITAKVIETHFIDYGNAQGFEARAVALRRGIEISAAEAMCLNDEPNWSKKPLFQLKSMAQTRACAKALRNVLAWVVVLAGYKPTPAEEMTGQEHKPSISQPGEKKPEPSKDTETLITLVDNVTMKDGKNEKTGKPWTKYIIHVGDKGYSTFDKNIAKDADQAKKSAVNVNLEFKNTTYGPEIVSLTIQEPPEPGSEG